MPLPDDASLFIPYEAMLLGRENLNDPGFWVAVQKQGDDLIFMSSVRWPTQEEAERHAHDLNWLREKALENMATTNLWISVDIAAENAEALTVLEGVLTDGQILGWRLLNPAADDDHKAWEQTRATVQAAFDTFAMEELPEDDESLEDHLRDRHAYNFEDEHTQTPTWYALHHRTLHVDHTHEWSHTHEWNDEEVNDDASDAQKGAHEDEDRG